MLEKTKEKEKIVIKYKDFFFAAPPRTGSTWFIKSASIVCLGDAQKSKLHEPPSIIWNGFLVSLVRHPYNWLCSYFLALEGGKTGVHCVDVLANYARTSSDVDEFILQYLKYCPGEVGRIFDRYMASSVLRLEDFPWNAIEFFESVGVKSEDALKVKNITPQNVRKGHVHIVNKNLKKQVVETERKLCERYEYY